jgi:hypothetical protein
VAGLAAARRQRHHLTNEEVLCPRDHAISSAAAVTTEARSTRPPSHRPCRRHRPAPASDGPSSRCRPRITTATPSTARAGRIGNNRSRGSAIDGCTPIDDGNARVENHNPIPPVGAWRVGGRVAARARSLQAAAGIARIFCRNSRPQCWRYDACEVGSRSRVGSSCSAG